MADQQGEAPKIVIDSGTATTFDIVAADGGFEGGIIAPGINLSMKALHEAAANHFSAAVSNDGRSIACCRPVVAAASM